MDGGGFIIFMIIMIVASVLEKIAKARGTPPGTRLPPGRVPPRAPRYGPTPPPPQPQQTQGRASDMVSEDFWRELTGRKPLPTRAPETLPPADIPSWDEEAVAEVEAARDEEAVVRPLPPAEPYRRPVVLRPAPEVVSLEVPPPPPERRHQLYHQHTQATSLPAAPPPDVPLRARLRRRDSLRDAFVLAEVFGTPKGLEQEPPRR